MAGLYECTVCGKDYNPWVRSHALIERLGASHAAHIIAKAKADLRRHEAKHASEAVMAHHTQGR